MFVIDVNKMIVKYCLCVILLAYGAQSAMLGGGMLLGGYRRVPLSDIEDLPYLTKIQDFVHKYLGGNYQLQLTDEDITPECAYRQLVNGLNYKVYYRVEGSKPLYCETKWYASFQGVIGHPKMHCSYSSEVSDKCLSSNLQTQHHRGRRSLSETSYPKPLTMNKGGKNLEATETLFRIFNFHFNRTYNSESSDVYQKKFETFSENWKLVQHLNEIERGTASYGMTKFMDYTTDEFKKYFAPGFSRQLVDTPKLADMSLLQSTPMPDSFDWREKGAVTPVKNQGECGSCWAFSTTGNVEGQWFRKTGKLVSLSEQELVDCDALDDGCEGGLPSNAYKTIEKLGGLETEGDYPYDGRDEKCNLVKSKLSVYVNSSVTLPTDEAKMAKWLSQHGPISIGINANLMQFYFGGISHPWKIFCNPKSLDHGVLIVGYGTEDDKPYWIIKNSWGPDWGEEGYYRIYRGDGSCGVNQMATSSVIN